MAARRVSVKEKLERARARLMVESPWLGSLASSVTLLPDENLMAFESDGRSLRYRPGFFEEAGVEVLEFVLANAALHRALGHDERRGARDRRLWQLATDHAINALLEKNGFFLPDFARGFERYASGYAESIYEELREQNPPKEEEDEEEREESPSDEAPSTPGNEGAHRLSREEFARQAGTQELDEKLEQERMRLEMERYAKEGELPEGIERLFPQLVESRIDWRVRLHRFFDPFVKNDYRFFPPNAKHLYRGVCLPSLNSEHLRIAVAVDSSGSIDAQTLATFLGELDGILEQFPDYHVDLIVADDRVRLHRSFETGEPLECEITGGGGTDFSPVFAFIEERLERPQALLYFTDGAGKYPVREPAYETLWVLSQEAHPPFGSVLPLDFPYESLD